MKTKEELNALKEEVETVSRKLHELTEEELAQVSGGKIKTRGSVSGKWDFYSIFTELSVPGKAAFAGGPVSVSHPEDSCSVRD